MKKIFTFLCLIALSVGGMAQGRNNGRDYDRHYDRDVARHDNGKWNKKRNNFKTQMENEIAVINREYNRRVEKVKSNWFMNRHRKQQMLNNLEEQRRADIRNVYAKYNDRRGRDYGSRW